MLSCQAFSALSEHGKEYETSQPELPDSLDLKAEKAWQESIVHELPKVERFCYPNGNRLPI
jgi:hypothetical protein